MFLSFPFFAPSHAEEAFSTPTGELWTADFPQPGLIGTLRDFDIAYRGVYDRRLVVELLPGDRDFLEAMGVELRPLPFNPALPKTRDQEDYRSYEETLETLARLAQEYPDLCRLEVLGYSTENRLIEALKISDNPDLNEDEPELRLAGAHHGDELMSVEIPLLAAEMLLDEYASNARIRQLVDDTEIWVVPLVNPDGREAVTRRNANQIDLNRNYGYVWISGNGRGDDPFSEPETQAMAEQHLERRFSLSHSFHTYGEIVNYTWNFTDADTPDEALLLEISRRYAEGTKAGGSEDPYEVTNGYDWYQTFGDLNDFSYGSSGGLDWTIELTPGTQNFTIERSWSRSRESILSTLEWSLRGLRGVVTDTDTGKPLSARIRILEHDWPVFTDPAVGDYHRLLLPGSYSVEVWASGYEARRFENVLVGSGDAARLDVELENSNEYYALRAVAVGTDDDNPTWTPAASGPPDELSYSLGNNRWIVLDLGETLDAHQGEEVEIIEGFPFDGERYKVEVGESFTGPWHELGSGSGACAFDFDVSGIEQGRYLRIQDLGDVVATTSPGFDLDTVRYYPHAEEIPDGDEDRDEETEWESMDTERGESDAQDTEMQELSDNPDCEPYEADPDKTDDETRNETEGEGDADEVAGDESEFPPGTRGGGCSKNPCGFPALVWYIGFIAYGLHRRHRLLHTMPRRTGTLCHTSILTPSPNDTTIGTPMK